MNTGQRILQESHEGRYRHQISPGTWQDASMNDVVSQKLLARLPQNDLVTLPPSRGALGESGDGLFVLHTRNEGIVQG